MSTTASVPKPSGAPAPRPVLSTGSCVIDGELLFGRGDRGGHLAGHDVAQTHLRQVPELLAAAVPGEYEGCRMWLLPRVADTENDPRAAERGPDSVERSGHVEG